MAEPHVNGVPLREYVEALFNEKQKQLEVASTEREKAAEALRGEQYRAMEQAEREREKAASAMRDGLDRGIKEGDERLREHIANQIQQINGALASAEKLESERLRNALGATDSVRREMQLITESAKEAVKKAEIAQQNVNVGQNEFRGQLKDQANELYTRREGAALDKRLQILERGQSGSAGQQRGSAGVYAAMLAVAVLVISIVSIVANVLAG